MLDDSNSGASADRHAAIRAAIAKWRDGLINLSASNRLLNFKLSRTGAVSLVRPSPDDVLTRLMAGDAYKFRSLKPRRADGDSAEDPRDEAMQAVEVPVPPPGVDMLDTDKDPDDLAAALRALLRRSTQEYLDRGLAVLYLAFGTLKWIDEDKSRYTSPLLLVPVQLEPTGPRQMPRLVIGEDDPVINPALALKFSQYGITLPGVDDLDEVSLNGLLSAVGKAVEDRDGWQVGQELVLSYFSFAKEAMYRDLLDHEDLIAAHAGVGALASGGGGREAGDSDPDFYFDEIPEHQVDEHAPPESTPVILDADSSQRACIAAALGGRSFVMDGPPGTGKSQTIANMIGVLLHAGKSVLFVSEKAAALDVVRDRLDEAGLRSYLLELHSHKATRKEVAAALGDALDRVPIPPAPMQGMNVETVRKRREQLNAYADAMNRPRDPLGSSLHDVLGVIAQLHEVPAAPATGIAPVDLTTELFRDLQATAETLSGAWRPAAQGRSFVWRGVAERGSLDARLFQAASALETLRGTARINAELADAMGLTRPSDAPALAALLEHLSEMPSGLPEEWLTADSLDAEGDLAATLGERLAEISAREGEAGRAGDVQWSAIPRADTLPALRGGELAELIPASLDIDGLTADQITATAQTLAQDADMLGKRAASLSGIASMLGLPAPQTFREATDLLTLCALGQEADRPERAWLSVPGQEAATEAARALEDAQQALTRAEQDASAFYTPDALHQDVNGLAHRFDAEHHGLGKLSGEYRADKRTVAGFTKAGVAKDAAHQQLALAVAWKNAATDVTEAEARHASILGAYYSGRTTDFAQLGNAIRHAAAALQAACGRDLSIAADHFACDAVPNATITGIADETRRDVAAWRAALAPPPVNAPRPELSSFTITEAIGWLRAHLGPLEAAATFTQKVSEVTERLLTVSEARQLVALRVAVDAAHMRLAEQDALFVDRFNELYAGAATDMGALRSALDWVQGLRAMVTGGTNPLTQAQAKAAGNAIPASHLAAAASAWQSTKDALVGAFDKSREADLDAELDDYDDAEDLIRAFREDTGGQEEWHVYQAARSSLASHHLDVAVDFCISERVPPGQVPDVIKRALLQEWADHHFKSDPALATVRGVDRDALVAEYQKLDRELISAATGGIIRACNARRPRTDVGEAAVIRREAEKKKKHMPVRVLIERSRNVTQRIKPCFMMSPLAVSQYLPADMKFDVVIFDEASQVSPGDAINCVYRGNALILAGDQKQLPPSNFFGPASVADGEEWSEETDDTADFESILDLAKASGAYRSLTLRWHYRSLHEALIAFSNTSFYEGKLITFPSRHSDGPDVGVELYMVEGTYRRGTSRDNPDEAAKVAERVIHHYDTRPHLTLGVVTFSEAQAEAIENAVGRAREGRPDLDKFFASDRLRGFFVKSLESVQGDERDVLIFSIGYGPDENRKITMNFGPLNKQGGWRRLNVAITRARYRNEIVSSIRAGDIPESVTSQGVRHLRRYLDYSARGMSALALDTSSGGDAESPFEESVISVIRSWGYSITPQVGTAGYRIDIGVHHPDQPGVYALGIECDGYQYHSSKVARDRDRLREKVLRGLGWHLHRIWGTAWYRDRKGEESRLREAIESAITAPVRGLLGGGLPEEGIRVVVETEAATYDASPDWAVPYRTAFVSPMPSWVDPGDPGSRYAMKDGVLAVVTSETPVHIAVLHQRLRDAWYIGRIGARIRENIDAAIRLAGVIRDGDFVTFAGTHQVTVRTPTQACARGIEQVHDDELSLALVSFVRDAAGISRNELTSRVARLYGWTRRGPDITSRMESLISRLRRAGTLTGDEDNLTVGG